MNNSDVHTIKEDFCNDHDNDYCAILIIGLVAPSNLLGNQ